MSKRFVIVIDVAATCVIALGAQTAAAAVNYPDFSDTAGLKLNGSTSVVGDAIRLTSSDSQAGSFFTKKAVVKPGKNLKTQFQLSQHDGSAPPADGMAFVIQEDSPSALGGGGEGLGYAGIDKSLIVEFDIYDNGESNGNHVGLMVNGDSADHLAAADPQFALYPNAPYAWVDYKAESKKVKVYVSTGDTKPDSPLLAKKVNLKKTLAGHNGYAGFTAATGGFSAVQDALSWKLKSG